METHQGLLTERNAFSPALSALPYGTTHRLVHRWEEQASHHPDAEALRADGQSSWSYGRVSQTAHRWADEWRQQGVRAGDRVLIHCPAGPAWVVAVWAAWLADLVWTPCAPDAPSAMLDALMADLDPRVIVSAQDLLDDPSFTYRRSSWPSPSDAAYILYPLSPHDPQDAVVILHEGLLPMIDEQVRAFGLDETSVALWMRSSLVGASISAVGTVLAAGGTLVIEPQKSWSDYDSWSRLVVKHGINVVDAPPRMMGGWVDHVPPPGLTTVIAAGLPPVGALLRSWSNRLRWISVYGPREATVCSSLAHRRIQDGQAVPLTLGHPIAGLVYRVLPLDALDADAEPVSEGELWIGGAGVAHGYWRRPALTAAHFWTDDDGIRWFRSNERVRRMGAHWHHLGTIEAHERLHQAAEALAHR